MSDEFYIEMQGVATELLEEFKTGVARLVRRTRTTPDNTRPLEKTNGSPTYTVLSGVVITVDKKMIDNKVIFGREAMLVCAHPGFDPLTTDKVEVDGRERTVLALKSLPGAGVRVAWKIVLAD